MIRLFVVSVVMSLFLGIGSTALAQTCSDISTIDFRNVPITLNDENANSFFVVPFRHGAFETKEAPESRSVDWRYEIIRDTTVNVNAFVKIRFIEIFANHLTGSGSWTYLVAFRCTNGAVESSFQQHGEGMRVLSLSPKELHLRFTVWKSNDPHCCPSTVRDVRYAWDSKHQTYAEMNFSESPIKATSPAAPQSP